MNLGDVCSRFLRLSRSPARRGAHMPPAAYKRGARTVGARGAARVTRCGSGSVVSRTSSQKRKDVVLEPRVKARRVHVGPGVGGGALGGRQLLRRRGRRRRGQKRGLRHRRGASTSTQPGTRVPLLVFFFFPKMQSFLLVLLVLPSQLPLPSPEVLPAGGGWVVLGVWQWRECLLVPTSSPLGEVGGCCPQSDFTENRLQRLWPECLRARSPASAASERARRSPTERLDLGARPAAAAGGAGAARGRRGGRRGGFGQRCRERRG